MSATIGLVLDCVNLLGVAEYERRQRDRRAQLLAVDEGLLRQSLLSATRPR